MTILVTGGTGLVGSRLLQRLVASGIGCRALVRPGKQAPAGVEMVEGDILDQASLVRAVDGVTAVVHLAALLRTPDTDAIWRTNLDGTRNLVQATLQHSPNARFVMASTSLVYDIDAAHPAAEADTVTPTAPYPASKLAAESELQKSDLAWSILRLGFVYGDADGHLDAIPRLAQVFKWHPAQALSLIHHQDMATAIELALTGALDRRIVNIVDEAPTTIYELAGLVGARIEPSADPFPNPWNGRLDGSLARSLGFRVTVPTVYHASREGTL